jgi:hypothetical protein
MILEIAESVALLRCDVADIEVFELEGRFYRVLYLYGTTGVRSCLDLALLTDDEGKPVTSENLLPNLLSEYGHAEFTVVESHIEGLETDWDE